MKNKLLILLFFVPCIASGQVTLEQSGSSGIYARGDKIAITASVGNPLDTVRIRILKNNTQVLDRKVFVPGKNKFVVYEGSFSECCSGIAEVKSGTYSASIGFIVDPENIKPGTSRPKDFEKFWNEQKKLLRKLPVNITEHAVSTGQGDIECSEIEINCTGPKSARGYYAKPVSAAKRSLPAVLLFHAAGVKGSWCRSEPGNAIRYAKMGSICFDLNAHGMLNGQPDSYYEGLENGELKNYFFQGVGDRNEFYFKGMYLRLLRTIDFIASQPEWDGRRILVIGESQGGGQALAAAGLDKRVSAVVALVPAMCDWFAPAAGRKGGWPQPYEAHSSKTDLSSSIPYFDASLLLQGSRATIFTEIGLIDQTCPSTSVYAAVNQAKGKKIIYAVPYRPLHQPQGELGREWEEKYYRPREQFIRDYLK